MTLADVYSAWRAEKQKSLRATSYSTYVLLVEKHIMPLIADKGPLTKEDVVMVRDKALKNGASERTAHDCAGILMGIIRFAAKKGWWPQPTWEMEKPSAPQKAEFRLLTKEEQRAIIEQIGKDCSARNIGIYLALTTGISMGELCNLTWQDIDFKAQALHVRGLIRRFYQMADEGESRTWSKSRDTDASVRDIPLAPEQLEFLKEEEGRHRPEMFIMSNDIKPTDPKVIRAHFKSLCNKADIKGVQFKDLRYTFAVRCIEAGCNYSTLALLLGNGNIARLAELYDKYIKKEPRKCMGSMMSSLLEDYL